MKTVVLLSKVFFEGHPKAGQPTNFANSESSNSENRCKPIFGTS